METYQFTLYNPYDILNTFLYKPWNIAHAFCARFYLMGPSFLGGWVSKKPSEICSRISDVSETFWDKNVNECTNLISRHFSSVIVLLESIISIYILYMFSKWFAYRKNTK